MTNIAIAVPSAVASWWKQCIFLSICKNQDIHHVCFFRLALFSSRVGSWETFHSLISYRDRHYRQVRQGARCLYRTFWIGCRVFSGQSAIASLPVERWGSSWTSHAAISDVPTRYRDSCAWCRATLHNTWCTARLAQRVVMQRCPSRFGLGYLLWVSCSVPWYSGTAARVL